MGQLTESPDCLAFFAALFCLLLVTWCVLFFLLGLSLSFYLSLFLSFLAGSLIDRRLIFRSRISNSFFSLSLSLVLSVVDFFVTSLSVTSLLLLTPTQNFRGRTLRSGHRRCRTPLHIKWTSVMLKPIYTKDHSSCNTLRQWRNSLSFSLEINLFNLLKYTSSAKKHTKNFMRKSFQNKGTTRGPFTAIRSIRVNRANERYCRVYQGNRPSVFGDLLLFIP